MLNNAPLVRGVSFNSKIDSNFTLCSRLHDFIKLW